MQNLGWCKCNPLHLPEGAHGLNGRLYFYLQTSDRYRYQPVSDENYQSKDDTEMKMETLVVGRPICNWRTQIICIIMTIIMSIPPSSVEAGLAFSAAGVVAATDSRQLLDSRVHSSLVVAYSRTRHTRVRRTLEYVLPV